MLNPNTRTCPIFHSERDATIVKAIYRRIPVLVDKGRSGPTGNPWGIKLKTMFHQTNDAEIFREAESMVAERFKLKSNLWVKQTQSFLPLYEAKMVEAYDHRFGTVYEKPNNWVNQGQTIETSTVQHQNPEFLVLPRYWASEREIRERAPEFPAFLVFRDITNPTNARTMISAFAPPRAGFINTAPFALFPEEIPCKRQTCIQANFGSYVFDYVARNKVHGRHMNFFALEQLPVVSPEDYSRRCPWNQRQTLEKWISERVLKLTCTAEDMLPLADACEFTGGSFKQEYGGRLNKWDEAERAALMAELDAAYFHLYGIDRDDAEYILSTFKGIHDRSLLLPGHQSIAEHILAEFDRLGH